jgi:hypothetical protein
MWHQEIRLQEHMKHQQQIRGQQIRTWQQQPLLYQQLKQQGRLEGITVSFFLQ